MRSNDLTPRPKASSGLSFHGYARFFTFLATDLLVEFHAESFGLHLVDLLYLWRRNGGKQSRDGINSAICVVGTECLLVGPLVADIAKLADKATIRGSENLPEAVVPEVPHDAKERLRVPV